MIHTYKMLLIKYYKYLVYVWLKLCPNCMPCKEQLTWIGFAFKPGQAYPTAPQNAFNEFIIPKSNPLIVVDFRFISVLLHA